MSKVFVGISGGVDSAVSAALLKERGHTVIGAFIKIWSPEFLECTWKEDRLDAMRVCAALQIPFREVDLSDAYKKEVVGDMLEKYSSGSTPNPDVMCNQSIKFGHFARWAFENGADMIATGHYARVREVNGAHQLVRAADTNKDQTYFLYRISQNILSRTLFPVGEFTKPQVRELAQKFDLPNAKRPDSQGLCFVGDVSMKDFLGRFIELRPGPVVNEEGQTIGTHSGAALYTAGERHGFTAKGSRVQYVVSVDIAQNTIYVSENREKAAKLSAHVSDMHWIGAEKSTPFSALAQARYREKPFEVTFTNESGSALAAFREPHIPARGQSLVLYDGEVCLGGGVIK